MARLDAVLWQEKWELEGGCDARIDVQRGDAVGYITKSLDYGEGDTVDAGGDFDWEALNEAGSVLPAAMRNKAR